MTVQIQQGTRIRGVTEKFRPGAGATPPCRVIASACAALVAPAPVCGGLNRVPGPVQTWYPMWTGAGTGLRPTEYLSRSELSRSQGRDCGQRGKRK